MDFNKPVRSLALATVVALSGTPSYGVEPDSANPLESATLPKIETFQTRKNDAVAAWVSIGIVGFLTLVNLGVSAYERKQFEEDRLRDGPRKQL